MIKVEISTKDDDQTQTMMDLVSLAKKIGLEARYIEGPNHVVVKVDPLMVKGDPGIG